MWWHYNIAEHNQCFTFDIKSHHKYYTHTSLHCFSDQHVMSMAARGQLYNVCAMQRGYQSDRRDILTEVNRKVKGMWIHCPSSYQNGSLFLPYFCSMYRTNFSAMLKRIPTCNRRTCYALSLNHIWSRWIVQTNAISVIGWVCWQQLTTLHEWK